MTGGAVRQHYVTSADGTKISASITGTGPPLVVSPGSLGAAEDWQFVADALAPQLTSYAVNRRGHGASQDSPSFSLEREQEDIAAVLDLAGPDATLLGHSYGAVIALGLALRQPPARLVLYEPPLPLDGPVGGAAIEDYSDAVRDGEYDRALTMGLREFVRMPDDAIAALRQQPIWSRLAAMTPSWTREVRAIDQFGSDLKRFGAISVPVLLIVGEASPPWLTDISRRLALVLPGAELTEIPGQAHDAHIFDAAVMGAKIADFAL